MGLNIETSVYSWRSFVEFRIYSVSLRNDPSSKEFFWNQYNVTLIPGITHTMTGAICGVRFCLPFYSTWDLFGGVFVAQLYFLFCVLYSIICLFVVFSFLPWHCLYKNKNMWYDWQWENFLQETKLQRN